MGWWCLWTKFCMARISHIFHPSGAGSAAYFTAPYSADGPGLSVAYLNLTTSRQKQIPAILATVTPRLAVESLLSPIGNGPMQISYPLGWVHTLPPMPDGCTDRAKTSDTAAANNCTFAVNGGTFDMNTGTCSLLIDLDHIHTRIHAQENVKGT